MPDIRAASVVAAAVLMMAPVQPAEAQRKGADTQGMSADGVERLDHKISATGLQPAFPPGFHCEPIASSFGSSARYDGSRRRDDRNEGLHGGLDLSLDEGTPLLAVAGGEVIALGEGGRLEGFFLWLRHSPTDTGQPFWAFSKYQHLSALPLVNKGDRVQAGQVVALSGSTGTAGGLFLAGYPHLHLGTFYGPEGGYGIKGQYQSQVSGKDAALDDPLILFLRGVADVSQVRALPEGQKTVAVAVVGEDGAVHPAGGKVVWPVRCKTR